MSHSSNQFSSSSSSSSSASSSSSDDSATESVDGAALYRPVLIHVNGVNSAVVESGYFAKILDFGQLLSGK